MPLYLIFLQIAGGVGLLLYGIEIMKDALEKSTEGSTVKLLEASGKSTFMSILAGAAVTTINQKSTATTVMVVGLVNAGMMSLTQAAGVIMGANIGTTVTAQLLAFRLEFAAPLMAGIAVIFWKYIKNKRVQYTAEIFIGCGIMFIGMMFIDSALVPLKDYPLVRMIAAEMVGLTWYQYLSIIAAGFLLTALVRSSSALTGIMIAMAGQGLLTLESGIPFIMGLNIGKCLTAMWYSRSATRTAKRAAMIHFLFNTLGAILVILFFKDWMQVFMEWLAPANVGRQLANSHTVFNLGTTIIAVPLIKVLVKLSGKLIPIKKEEENKQVSNLDVRMLETPGIALAQAASETADMAAHVCSIYDTSYQAVRFGSEKLMNRVFEEEDSVIRMQKDIEIYLVKLSRKDLTDDQQASLKLLLGVTGDVERISDVAYSIAELAEYKKKNSIQLSASAYEEIDDLHSRIMETAGKMVQALRDGDEVLANSLMSAEIKLKNMEDQLRMKHIERLNQGICSPGSGILYLDLIGHMERVVEYLRKIGIFVIENAKY